MPDSLKHISQSMVDMIALINISTDTDKKKYYSRYQITPSVSTVQRTKCKRKHIVLNSIEESD